MDLNEISGKIEELASQHKVMMGLLRRHVIETSKPRLARLQVRINQLGAEVPGWRKAMVQKLLDEARRSHEAGDYVSGIDIFEEVETLLEVAQGK